MIMLALNLIHKTCHIQYIIATRQSVVATFSRSKTSGRCKLGGCYAPTKVCCFEFWKLHLHEKDSQVGLLDGAKRG